VKELEKLMETFNMLENIKDMQALRANLMSVRISVMFILAYDVKNTPNLNIMLLRFFKDYLCRPEFKIGVITEMLNKRLKLELVQREVADADLENLIIRAEERPGFAHIYDTLLRCAEEFAEDSTDKYAVLILNGEKSYRGHAWVDDLHVFSDKDVKIIVICEKGMIEQEFLEILLADENEVIYVDFDLLEYEGFQQLYKHFNLANLN
jgi:hypothetical protein